MNFKIKYAEKLEIEKVIEFFSKHINKDNDWIISEEFLCPYWIKWAILRKQMIIIVDNNDNIFWALRFYPRKIDDIISVYQFALDERIRGKDIIKKMLKFTGYNIFQAQSFVNSNFNNYYIKQNWKLIKENEKNNCWELVIK